jgi:signal transduction histidine kinase
MSDFQAWSLIIAAAGAFVAPLLVIMTGMLIVNARRADDRLFGLAQHGVTRQELYEEVRRVAGRLERIERQLDELTAQRSIVGAGLHDHPPAPIHPEGGRSTRGGQSHG